MNKTIMFNLKQKVAAIAVIVVIILISVFVFRWVNTSKAGDSNISSKQSQKSETVSEKDPPQIVSTKPDPLEEAIIGANDTVEITFNRPLENIGEFKVRMEPEVEYKLELSGDRKTGKIIPLKPYNLGTSFTLFIGTETKFDGIGRWGQEKIYHFQTIKYRGI